MSVPIEVSSSSTTPDPPNCPSAWPVLVKQTITLSRGQTSIERDRTNITLADAPKG